MANSSTSLRPLIYYDLSAEVGRHQRRGGRRTGEAAGAVGVEKVTETAKVAETAEAI